MAASAYFAPPTKSAVSDGVSTRGLLSTAAALVLSIAPWTIAVRLSTHFSLIGQVMMPTNSALFALDRQETQGDSDALIRKWTGQHAVRSAVSTAALVLSVLSYL